MGKPIFSTGQLPTHHEGMLIVKIRSSASPRAAMAATRETGSLLESPGLSALSMFERAGLIKQVTPLARQIEEEMPALGTRRVMAALAASAERVPPANSNAGVSIIELERERDVPELQIALANDPNVEFVSRVPVRYLVSLNVRPGGVRPNQVPSDNQPTPNQTSNLGAGILAAPPPASTMWNLSKISWAEARALQGFNEATDIRVAVLDTGIDAAHPDLRERVSSYVFEHPDLLLASGERDIVGHGTHVAGTIGALVNNDLGINGICECKLHIWKIFDDGSDFISFRDGFMYFVEPVMYRRALADCLNLGVNVINLSIGGPGRPDAQEQMLFDALLANGTTIVAAMGNSRMEGSPTEYPAAIPGVIAVGATSINDTVANFSTRGNHISLSAPGVAIWSTLPTYPGQFGFEAIPGPDGRPIEGKSIPRETDFDAWDGTSMATPHVVGAAALLLANKGKMNAASVRTQLMKTADKVTRMRGSNFSPDYGAGRLNLLRLLSE